MSDVLTIKDIKTASQEITEFFLKNKSILVYNQRVYENKGDHYSGIGTEEQLIPVIYRSINRAQIAKVSTHAIKEAAGRIMSHPDLQFDFDAERIKNATKLNLLNGEYVIETKRFTENQRSATYDYVLSFKYIRGSRIERAAAFMQFIESSLGREYLDCVLRILAYCISSLTKARKAFLLLGKGATGKSTLLDFLEAVAGTENTSHVPFHSMSDLHARAEYQGKRVNISRDNSDLPMKSEDAFKSLVSCEMTTGRLLYHNRIDFVNCAKFIFASNVPLHFAHPDDAVYDRLLVIPFEREIPESKKDPELLEKLLKEKDIVFSVAIDQLADLISSHYDFKELPASKRIIEQYRAALHTADSFLQECYVIDLNGSVSSVKLYNHYANWCAANGMEADKKQAFYAKVRAYSSGIYDSKVYSEGNRVCQWLQGHTAEKSD